MAHFTSAMLFALYMVVVILFPVWGLSTECGMSVMRCILSVYTLLKVVKSHCDLSVLAVSLMSFKKKLDRGVGGLSSIFLGFLEFVDFAKPLSSVILPPDK